ncbi:golgi SNAP receptor complex member bos1 [Rickenella mellea]|uniref:Protein transport protein BOS1 n=1 Tax=Rickenella mellea TaxID=50990 RepID=A0A4Y7QGI4_9AGAM|nr:golgi SNAP receptor complex member bos1 [Rickenella mellea]
MNSLYTLGVRQTSSIQADLERMKAGESSAALQGQISASLAALHRTIEDFDSVAKREMMKAKQEKAQMRVQKFRTDYNELRSQFERYKVQASNERTAAQRSELLSTANATSPSDARRRFSQMQSNRGQSSTEELVSESPFRSATPSSMATTSLDRESFALREHSFAQETESALDGFLVQAREAYDNLRDQRTMLKGTQKRLLDAANTLGLSRDVIGWIERRSTQDMYIFFAGAIFTFYCFYLIWKCFG